MIKNEMADLKRRGVRVCIALVLMLMVQGAVFAPPYYAFAEKTEEAAEASEADEAKTAKAKADKSSEDEETESVATIREVHKVKIKNKKYCFFAEKNLVLTPDKIAAMTDEKLVAKVVAGSGIIMKRSNCTKASSEIITPADWIKKGGSFWLNTEDIKSLRAANPEKGKPVKLHMDLKISTKSESKKDAEKRKREAAEALAAINEAANTNANAANEGGSPETSEDYSTPRLKYYSTYKKTGEELLLVIVANGADAKDMPGYCEESNGFEEDPEEEKGGSGGEDMLPEYRTISMVDRSGAPIPSVLEDGEPVTLVWEDIKRSDAGENESRSITDAIPGGVASLAAIVMALIAAIAAMMRIIIRRIRR